MRIKLEILQVTNAVCLAPHETVEIGMWYEQSLGNNFNENLELYLISPKPNCPHLSLPQENISV
jgi:hypothetical protein